MGGSGVQRPLKFVKYLREFGWNPIVLCPEPGMYPYFDESLEAELKKISPEIIRIRPKTLFHLGTWSVSAKKTQIPNILSKTARRFLRLFMYPDNKKGWIKPAVEKGLEVIQGRKIDLIFSTAPPFSNHMAAAQLSQKSEIPLVLDYRDLWLNNHFMDDMFGWQKGIMKRMEKFSLEIAQAITGLDSFMLHDIQSNYPEINVTNYEVPHGYDPEDFSNLDNKETLDYKKGKLNFLYSGIFYEQNQPDKFLSALKKAGSRGAINMRDVHLHFQGGLDERIRKFLVELGLKENVTDYGYVTHDVAVANLIKADVLWMVSNFKASHKQIKSGKLFEYFGTGKPILGLVHEGASSRLINEYGAGFFGDLTSEEVIIQQLESIYKKWKSGSLPQADQEFIEQFNRRSITRDLAQIFDKISSQ